VRFARAVWAASVTDWLVASAWIAVLTLADTLLNTALYLFSATRTRACNAWTLTSSAWACAAAVPDVPACAGAVSIGAVASSTPLTPRAAIVRVRRVSVRCPTRVMSADFEGV
jgi:hypothetical protein